MTTVCLHHCGGHWYQSICRRFDGRTVEQMWCVFNRWWDVTVSFHGVNIESESDHKALWHLYREELHCKSAECTSGADGVRSIVQFLVHMCLVAGLSVSNDDNDNNRQCTVYSSVCFKNSIWQECQVRHFKMHEKHHMSEQQERKSCILCNLEM